MITAKTLIAITVFCSSYIDYPHYSECPIKLPVTRIGGEVEREPCHPSPINRDARYICEAVVKDCVKDLGYFSKCKNGKWKYRGGPHDVTLLGIIDEVVDWEHYAPSDAMLNYKRESNYGWRRR